MEFNKLPIWLQSMPYGADNEPDDSGANDGQQQQNSGNQPNPGSGQQNPPAGNAGDDEDDPYKGLSLKEVKRLLAETEDKKKTAETERDSYKTKVDEEARKTRSKEENLEADNQNLMTENQALKGVNAKLAIINAILMDDRYQWNNVEVVAGQLNSEVVKVNDDGKVDGLKKELDRVAKENAWMLKANDQGQQQNNGGQGPTGFQPGQGGANGGGVNQPNIDQLVKVMPALQSRR